MTHRGTIGASKLKKRTGIFGIFSSNKVKIDKFNSTLMHTSIYTFIHQSLKGKLTRKRTNEKIHLHLG